MPPRDRIAGLLLGTALGDALGLPLEGLSAAIIRKRFPDLEAFHLIGQRGFVSDDTEQSALVAEALLGVPALRLRRFRQRLRRWFLRLPFGIGLSTLRACVRLCLFLPRTGIHSAGNGAAMRSAVLGVLGADERVEVARELARVTHTDLRATDGAAYVAALAGACLRAGGTADRATLAHDARGVVSAHALRAAIGYALDLASSDRDDTDAAALLGNTGFVVHTLGLATYMFVRHGHSPWHAIERTVAAGGDTDSNAAIVGAWVGALHGEAALPPLVEAIDDGPFGPTHLRALATALAEGKAAPRWSWTRAMLRNLMLYPVVLAHGVRRLLPW